MLKRDVKLQLTNLLTYLLPERHQWKPAVQTAAVMLRTPPRRLLVTGKPATATSHIQRAIFRTPPLEARSPGRRSNVENAPPSPAGHRPAARAHPAERSHYVVISRDGRKLVTRVRVVAIATQPVHRLQIRPIVHN